MEIKEDQTKVEDFKAEVIHDLLNLVDATTLALTDREMVSAESVSLPECLPQLCTVTELGTPAVPAFQLEIKMFFATTKMLR